MKRPAPVVEEKSIPALRERGLQTARKAKKAKLDENNPVAPLNEVGPIGSLKRPPAPVVEDKSIPSPLREKLPQQKASFFFPDSEESSEEMAEVLGGAVEEIPFREKLRREVGNDDEDLLDAVRLLDEEEMLASPSANEAAPQRRRLVGGGRRHVAALKGNVMSRRQKTTPQGSEEESPLVTRDRADFHHKSHRFSQIFYPHVTHMHGITMLWIHGQECVLSHKNV